MIPSSLGAAQLALRRKTSERGVPRGRSRGCLRVIVNAVADARDGEVLLPVRAVEVVRGPQGLGLDRLERFAEDAAVEVVGREAQEMPDGGSDVGVAGRQLIDEVRLEVGAG